MTGRTPQYEKEHSANCQSAPRIHIVAVLDPKVKYNLFLKGQTYQFITKYQRKENE